MKVSIFKWILQKPRLLKELNDLREHNKKLSEIKMVLDQREKIMILDALLCDEYSGKIRIPATKHFIRKIYRGLLAKVRACIKEDYSE
ncbi:MAG: hypothetical protein KAV87_50600 [Desulfobacteraceae bacterium]|nr:hypothetical protein [Desulfobacteraceae bacterium]